MEVPSLERPLHITLDEIYISFLSLGPRILKINNPQGVSYILLSFLQSPKGVGSSLSLSQHACQHKGSLAIKHPKPPSTAHTGKTLKKKMLGRGPRQS